MSGIWNYANAYEYMDKVKRNTMPPLIISVAVTGGAGGKELNPNVPESPDEQASQTYDAYNAGASVVHLHARDETGAECVGDPMRFREIHRKIRELCPDIIIGDSTGVGPEKSREECIGVLESDPEICSLNMGAFALRGVWKARKPPLTGREEDIHREFVFPFTPSFHEEVAGICLKKNIKPELEIYNVAMFEALQNLIRQDLLKKPYWIQLVLTPPAAGIVTPKNLINLIDSLPSETMFSVAAVGPFELPLTTIGMLLGGNVRVGLEDNIYYRKGELATSNAQLVERAVRMAREFGREIATPSQAREMLSISQTPRIWD